MKRFAETVEYDNSEWRDLVKSLYRIVDDLQKSVDDLAGAAADFLQDIDPDYDEYSIGAPEVDPTNPMDGWTDAIESLSLDMDEIVNGWNGADLENRVEEVARLVGDMWDRYGEVQQLHSQISQEGLDLSETNIMDALYSSK